MGCVCICIFVYRHVQGSESLLNWNLCEPSVNLFAGPKQVDKSCSFVLHWGGQSIYCRILQIVS